MSFKIEHNVATGEVIEIPLTAAEIEEQEKRAAIVNKEVTARQELRNQEEAKKQAAIAKLESLGLDLDDLKALGLG